MPMNMYMHTRDSPLHPHSLTLLKLTGVRDLNLCLLDCWMRENRNMRNVTLALHLYNGLTSTGLRTIMQAVRTYPT